MQHRDIIIELCILNKRYRLLEMFSYICKKKTHMPLKAVTQANASSYSVDSSWRQGMVLFEGQILHRNLKKKLFSKSQMGYVW